MSQSKKHIALFLADLSGGGAERVMLDLAQWFAQRGVRVDLLVLKKRGEYVSEVPEGVRLHELGGKWLLLQVVSMWRYLRKERPVAMLSTLIGCNLMAVVMRKLGAPSMCLVLREMDTLSRRLVLRPVPTRLLYRALAKRLYHRADVLIAVSQGVKDDVAALLPKTSEKLEVIYNPTLTPRLQALATGAAVPHLWLKERSYPVLVTAGRLVAQKDHATLLEALTIMRATVPARLIVLGQGALKASLMHRAEQLGIRDAVDFVGFQANPMAYMVHADLYVLSSRNEGMPNSLIQAMACGCEVVATDCPSGPREILQNGALGRLVPVGDAQAMADAALDALKAPSKREALITRAQDFHIDRIAPLYAASLGLALEEGNSSNAA